MDDESEPKPDVSAAAEPADSTAAAPVVASAGATAAMIVGAVALAAALVVVGWRLTVRPKAAPPSAEEA